LDKNNEDFQAKFSLVLKLATELNDACGPEGTMEDVKDILV
jgi:hypothetical protein